ncbi:MAG: FliA/WhiG family RNA polymerase sigma factor [Clostridia bacterium]|nr:FliA/WhiG family RNA polymerase sigma factor [Clostridia bacterium]
MTKEYGTVTSEVQPNIDELWDVYFERHDPAVKNQIIAHYIYLVVSVVKRLMPQYTGYADKDDLLSSGMVGLIDAVNKFDKSFEVKFQTYATVRIRGEVIDYIRRQDWAPTSLRKKISTVQKGFETLELRLGRQPQEQEVADYLNVPLAEVQKVLYQSHMFNLVHFETLLEQPSAPEPVAARANEPQCVAEQRETQERLQKLIESLPEKERMVVTLHYYEGLTMKNIARILKISEARVSQIHSKVLLQMRKALDSDT